MNHVSEPPSAAPRTPSLRWWSRLALGAAGLLVAVAGACSSAGIIGQVAIEAGRKFLLNAASSNYQPDYAASLEKLLDRVMKPNAVKMSAAAEGGAEGAAPAPVEREPLEIDVAVYRELLVDGRSVPVPLEDGETVMDGHGREGSGDNLKVRIRPNTDAWVYVVWVDSTGWAQPVFPSSMSASANPLSGGQELDFPEGDEWIYLDNYRGVENIYVVASYERRPDLEEVFAELEGLTRELRVEEPMMIDEEVDLTRGIGGTRRTEAENVQTSDGAAHTAPAQTFISNLAGSDVVISRWFVHR